MNISFQKAQGAVLAGLTEATAADIMWAMANPDTHYALVSERGWEPGQYEQWLTRTLAGALLRTGPGQA